MGEASLDRVIRRRPQLVWLLLPYVLFVAALPFVNRVPLLVLWLLGATLVTPVAVGLARRADLKRGERG
nr:MULTISPECIES: hypothetical protein [unclassified Streptomyces]